MASMRPGGGKPQNANQGRGFCGILLSIIKWVTIIVGMILLLMYFGVFTRLGAYSWIDSYKDSDGNERFKGIAPWVHHGKPWGFKLKELKDGSLADRVIIVTGANVGLGFSSAVALAGKGAEVVMACRSPEKCAKAAEDARERIQTMKGHGHVHPMILDLASFESIRLFVENFHSKYSSLHSLMLNAGIMMTPFGLTADGIEQQIGNFLSLFFFFLFIFFYLLLSSFIFFYLLLSSFVFFFFLSLSYSFVFCRSESFWPFLLNKIAPPSPSTNRNKSITSNNRVSQFFCSFQNLPPRSLPLSLRTQQRRELQHNAGLWSKQAFERPLCARAGRKRERTQLKCPGQFHSSWCCGHRIVALYARIFGR